MTCSVSVIAQIENDAGWNRKEPDWSSRRGVKRGKPAWISFMLDSAIDSIKQNRHAISNQVLLVQLICNIFVQWNGLCNLEISFGCWFSLRNEHWRVYELLSLWSTTLSNAWSSSDNFFGNKKHRFPIIASQAITDLWTRIQTLASD